MSWDLKGECLGRTTAKVIREAATDGGPAVGVKEGDAP